MDKQPGIFLICPRRQIEHDAYFEEAVVIADSAREARMIHPSGDESARWDQEYHTWGGMEDDEFNQTWVPPYDVVAERIGDSNGEMGYGVVLSSLVELEEEDEGYTFP